MFYLILDNITKIFIFAYSRAISSVGSEHLPYKQGVTGSNPVSPTKTEHHNGFRFFIIILIRTINSVGLECYLDRVEVTGSNPVWSTKNKPTQMNGFIIY